ncbi:MAG: GGDEF domain-containing protein [Steroidobacteraceae bacterium]|jgi:diguanylate cyclase (GGDEF)-like protein|nr:GGDEF domain-containing protein [Gammaproteobacteria bacterium]
MRLMLRHAGIVVLYGVALMSFSLLVVHITIDDWEYERLRAHLVGVPVEEAWKDYFARRRIPVALAALGLVAGAAVGFRAVLGAATVERERRSALEDPLTRLPNRRAFDQQLRALALRARWFSRPASLLFIDLDGFKQLNDGHGHALGDRVLISVAVTLRNCLDRHRDFCCRWGGDEFVILLPGTARDGAVQVAERVVHALHGIRVSPVPGSIVRVSGSVGVATFNAVHADAVEELPRVADHALALAKRAGKDRYVISSRASAAEVVRSL